MLLFIIIIIQTYYEEKTGRDKACQSHLSIEEHPHSSFCTLTRLSLSPTDCDQRQGRATLQPHHSLSQNIVNCCSSLTQRNHIVLFQHFNTTFTFILVLISYSSIKLGPSEEFHFCSLYITGMFVRRLKSEILHIVYICHTCTTSMVAKLPTLTFYIEMCGHVYGLRNPCLGPRKFISYCYLWLVLCYVYSTG